MHKFCQIFDKKIEFLLSINTLFKKFVNYYKSANFVQFYLQLFS